ncbi:NrtR DNA-binding winged helix domain-containing protein [Desulfobulbus sp.]|uniref:NUDIX hydrolase n=1 Tax=Desulfobulbus sp. TaxID=895 RepID=UPI00286FAC1A|nr:NUDIX domain-containing protein [Desulfobulbus sp.]
MHNKKIDKGHPVILTVDVVLLTLTKDLLQVALQKRDKEPYFGQPALPGGYVHAEEDIDSQAAARRVLREKLGLISPYLEQLYTFASATRDPRGWSASISYYALLPHEAIAAQQSDRLLFLPADDLPQLPFDHNRIIDTAVKRLRDKSTYSALPCHLLPELFTLSELQQTYEQILGHPLDKSAFRRKISDLGFLEATSKTRKGVHRPAQLHRIKPANKLILFNRTI